MQGLIFLFSAQQSGFGSLNNAWYVPLIGCLYLLKVNNNGGIVQLIWGVRVFG